MAHFLLDTAWLIPSYPIMGMILSIFWSPGLIRLTGPRPAGYANLIFSLLALIHSLFVLPQAWQLPPQYLNFPWLNVAGLDLTLPLEISAVTIGACVVITGLNALAQVYAVGYLEMDWGWSRFFAMLAMFEAGMCALVLCNSLFFGYMILEILTLGTYLLVGVWYNQPLVVTGARDAFLTKRVGDLFLLMGVLAIYPLAGTWDFNGLAAWAKTANVDPTLATLVGLGLLAGPMGKCAQFPLHLWLDEAMEGPLPSTILRNSVVVATGAWVLVKLQPVLALSPVVVTATIAIGALTAIGGTLISIAQIDIKRSLSYTVSAYMGLIFIAVGTGQTQAALLLILTHALAQALLVMSTGSIVLNNITQDLTQLGGLWTRRPIVGISFLVGLAGLVALPPFGGFWALLQLTDGLWESHPVLVGIVLVVNALAAFAMTREFGLIFAGKPQPMTERSPENIWLITLPMTFVLGIVLHLPLILQSLDLLPSWAVLNKSLALLLIWSTLLGAGLGAVVYVGQSIPKPIELPWKKVQALFAYDLYTPQIYRSSIVFVVDWTSRIVDWFDRFIVDGVVNLVGIVSLFGGETLKYSNTGRGQAYIFTIVVGLTVFVAWITWRLLLP
ncbi:NAD(P)H-quinone oxidoreductase subunit F [Thermosynechococcaceae cyanobacterium BACA0444]|uniref:NAD(P)H-quinone oxidoreductase subunit F n=1 Tax=Pseudocalidococcus azoricus BACA0444 TaxID=2918990 RepID=A0AAE4JWA7_9CYAN|nr:NAD(P)H-quinone oxidoreductase subunit F [Pseudocalidococcus azoricus]MDS3859948.1 NAD(P)H-quinone oxidoreductase subunit F [Pseudocalidococcus azoricus BACA0444]